MSIDYSWDLYRCAIISATVRYEPRTLVDTIYLSNHMLTDYCRMINLVYADYDKLNLWRFVNDGFEEWLKESYETLKFQPAASTVVIPWGVNDTRITAVIGKTGVTPVAIYPMTWLSIVKLLNQHPLQFKDYASKVHFYNYGIIVVDDNFRDWDEAVNMALYPIDIKGGGK